MITIFVWYDASNQFECAAYVVEGYSQIHTDWQSVSDILYAEFLAQVSVTRKLGVQLAYYMPPVVNFGRFCGERFEGELEGVFYRSDGVIFDVFKGGIYNDSSAVCENGRRLVQCVPGRK